MIDLGNIRDDIEQLLHQAGKVVKDGFRESNKEVSSKRDVNDLLTKFDIQANNIIVEHLSQEYPTFSIVSEESPEIKKDSEYTFLIDPIDGTRNFVRNIPIFHIGVALVKNNQTILSLTYNPITDELFHAIKGKGTYVNGDRIMVGDRAIKSSDLNLRTIPDKKLEATIASKIVGIAYQVGNRMCTHDEISGIAFNRYDGFISKGSSPWDYCHYLLVTEAGGKVTDWKGECFDVTKDNIIVSNGVIHEDLLQLLK